MASDASLGEREVYEFQYSPPGEGLPAKELPENALAHNGLTEDATADALTVDELALDALSLGAPTLDPLTMDALAANAFVADAAPANAWVPSALAAKAAAANAPVANAPAADSRVANAAAGDSHSEDRRTRERSVLRVQARILVDNEAIEADTIGLSPHGVAVTATRPLNIDQDCRIELGITVASLAAPPMLRASVRYCAQLAEGRFRIGMKFTTVSIEAAELIVRALEL